MVYEPSAETPRILRIRTLGRLMSRQVAETTVEVAWGEDRVNRVAVVLPLE